MAAGEPLAACSASSMARSSKHVGFDDLVHQPDAQRLIGRQATVPSEHGEAEGVAEPDPGQERNGLDRGDLADADVRVEE